MTIQLAVKAEKQYKLVGYLVITILYFAKQQNHSPKI